MKNDPTEACPPEVVQDLSELLPSTVIRAETALSRYPIHNLTKTEKINIHIRQRAEVGETDIYWNVSPSREYGEPRQLAYKLDTLVINRRIDEAGRPVPKLIRLGSLRDICKELELAPGGENFAGIRLALLQNASAFITAKLTYRGADRITRRFEAAFSRYSVVFTGEELPDNSKADAVHLFLNEHYWKLLNKVQFRPLDYAYQKNLKPAAHRFYELLSYSMYGALSKRRGEARLVYSDYCLRAPQERYLTRAQVQKQMYKIHRPHLESQYLAEARYEKTVDAEGNPDWEIFYKPGPRARAQFQLFNGRQAALEEAGAAEVRKQAAMAGTAVPEGRRAAEMAALAARGVTEAQARRLLDAAPAEQPVLEQLAWGDHLIRQSRPGSFRNPPGFYVHLVRDNVLPPEAFRSQARAAAGQGREVDGWRRRELETAYEEYRQAEARRYISGGMAAGEFAAAVERKKLQLRRTYKSLLPEALEEIAAQAVEGEIARRIPARTFEEFCREKEEAEARLASALPA